MKIEMQLKMEDAMRSFSLAARKSQLVFLVVSTICGLAYTSAACASDRISGAQIKQRINSFLAAKNLAGEPAISENRLFPACESEVSVRPMFGGMKTVELSCPDPGGFKIAVRTNAVSHGSRGPLTGDANRNTAKLMSLTELKDETFGEDCPKNAAEKYLAMARSVQKGQKIIIQSTSGPVVVVSSGISQGNAQVGELLQVQNQHSGKLVEGIVVSRKKIKVLTK